MHRLPKYTPFLDEPKKICLFDLPTEILCQIAQYLSSPDPCFSNNALCNLRLTCRSISLKTQYAFATAGFSALFLDLCPRYLQRSLAICAGPVFAAAVRRLTFRHHREWNIPTHGEFSKDWGHSISFPHVQEPGLEKLEDQVRFLLRSVLDKLFHSMVHLREVVIDAPYVMRFRRPSHALFPEEGEDFEIEAFAVSSEVLWGLISQVVVESNRKIESMQITRPSTEPYARAQFPTFSISSGALARTPKCVERVVVAVDAQCVSLSTALNFLSEVTCLDLTIACSARPYFYEPWPVASRANMRSLQHVRLPRLSSLTLRGAVLEVDTLTCLLNSHKKSLEYLSLNETFLVNEGWRAILTLLAAELMGLNELHVAGAEITYKTPKPFLPLLKLVSQLEVRKRLAEILGRM